MTANAQDLVQRIASGERRALAQAITLVESARDDHRAQARAVLDTLPRNDAVLRIGLSGTPGVGKSTFIEAFGMMLIAKGLRVAVLAVDPSSTRSGGSILGDKTRMDRLSRETRAFIRPSPSQSYLGGVARRTRDVARLCEGAGYDVILIETVGVGQSETAVARMCDLFLLLLAPAGGDELQGVKRGIMEMADLVLVNKADGDLKPAATRTCADYAGALRLMRKRARDPDDFPKALMVSALQEIGLGPAWDEMQTLTTWRRETGILDKMRREQAQYWFREDIRAGLLAQMETPAAQTQIDHLAQAVAAGDMPPETAAETALTWLRENVPPKG